MAYGEDTVLIAKRLLKSLNESVKELPLLVLQGDTRGINRILEAFDHYLSESEDPDIKVLDYVTQSDYDSFDPYELDLRKETRENLNSNNKEL